MSDSLKEIEVHHIESSWHELETKVAEPLGLEVDPVGADSEALLKDADRLSRVGIIQGLQDLGFLPEKPPGGRKIGFSQDEVESAIAQWLTETRETPAIYRSPEGTEDYSEKEISLIDPLPVLIAQTSFDGNCQLKKMPARGGAVDLGSRILQFRLKTFNRFGGRVGTKTSRENVRVFAELRPSFCQKKNELDITLLNRLGDGWRLSEIFCQKYKDQIFVTTHGGGHESRHSAEDYVIRVEKSTRSRNPRLRRRAGKIRVLSRRRPRRGALTLQERFETDVNSLGLELLQLRLWQHGYYKGVVDADWGPFSQEAFDAFIQTVRTRRRKSEFIAEVEGGQVVNLTYIFEELLGLADTTIADIKHGDIETLSADVFPEKDASEEWNKFEQTANDVIDDTVEANQLESVQTFRFGEGKSSRRRRRTNYSLVAVKGAITGWFRAIGRKLKRVAKNIRNAIIKGAKSVYSFFRYALMKVKRVVRVAKAAVQRLYYWVSGKPFGSLDPQSNSFFLTRWSMDFDTVNIVSRGVAKPLIEYHHRRIHFMNASFHFMISLSLSVLGVFLKISTGNWLRAAYAIYKAVIDLPEWSVFSNPFLEYTEGRFVS